MKLTYVTMLLLGSASANAGETLLGLAGERNFEKGCSYAEGNLAMCAVEGFCCGSIQSWDFAGAEANQSQLEKMAWNGGGKA